jgi:hypothetical protein
LPDAAWDAVVLGCCALLSSHACAAEALAVAAVRGQGGASCSVPVDRDVASLLTHVDAALGADFALAAGLFGPGLPSRTVTQNESIAFPLPGSDGHDLPVLRPVHRGVLRRIATAVLEASRVPAQSNYAAKPKKPADPNQRPNWFAALSLAVPGTSQLAYAFTETRRSFDVCAAMPDVDLATDAAAILSAALTCLPSAARDAPAALTAIAAARAAVFHALETHGVVEARTRRLLGVAAPDIPAVRPPPPDATSVLSLHNKFSTADATLVTQAAHLDATWSACVNACSAACWLDLGVSRLALPA